MKRSCKPFLYAFAIAFAVAAALFALVVSYCGRGYCSQPWFKDFHPLKRYFAAQKASPKIILYGGSSSLYGIVGEDLRRYTGMDNINFSSSILMPMRFYLADLEAYMGEGDVVVLPLETTMHYCETEAKVFSDFGLSCLLGVLPETKRYLSACERISLYADYGFSWIEKTLFHEDATARRKWAGDTKQGVFEGLHSETYVSRAWKAAAAGQIPRIGPLEMSCHGDWIIDRSAKPVEADGLTIPCEITGEFLATYRRINELVESRHGTLLLVWPNQYSYAEQTGMEEFAAALLAHGIRICGRPESTAFPKSLYFEPVCHMNRQGARLWTRELAKTICIETGRPFLGGEDAWPYVVFADNPAACFPEAERPEVYESGVLLREKSFSVVVRLPEDLRGHDLDVSIIMKPLAPGGKSLTAISCGSTILPFDERCFKVRSECRIFVPNACTKSAVLKLDLARTGESLGLERLFMCRSATGAAAIPGRYSVACDVEYVRLGRGFSNMEPWGCWTDGGLAQLELVVPQRLRGKDLQLTIEAYTFVTDWHPICEFAFASGDRHLADFASREFQHEFSLAVPAVCVKGETLPLTIRVKNPVSHKELGKGSDPRRLGVGLRRVQIGEAEGMR